MDQRSRLLPEAVGGGWLSEFVQTLFPMKIPLLLLSVLTATALAADQLSNLGGANPSVRPKVTAPSWPVKPGEAHICFWKDDRVAPVCITVDDNNAPDVPWWIEMADKYGFKVTWFIITRNVGGRGVGGTWDLWKDVLAHGHDVQSHTHTHLHADEPGWGGIEWEYSESQKLIEENLPGHRVRFLAYPGGKNSKLNDRAVAEKYYVGARCPTGALVSPTQVNYFWVSAVTEESFDNPASRWADLKRVVNPDDKLYRGWAILLYHTMHKKTEEHPLFRFLADNKETLWLAPFGEVSLYGQERDAATLNVTENTPQKITFTLANRLDSAIFDFPLTVKVRLPEGWVGATATQANQHLDIQVVEHDGGRFALLQTVPNRGEVTVTAK